MRHFLALELLPIGVIALPKAGLLEAPAGLPARSSETFQGAGGGAVPLTAVTRGAEEEHLPALGERTDDEP